MTARRDEASKQGGEAPLRWSDADVELFMIWQRSSLEVKRELLTFMRGLLAHPSGHEKARRGSTT